MAERASADRICVICRGRIRRGEPVRGAGSHTVGGFAHASCVAATLSAGTDGCACGHSRADHSVAEGGRCTACVCTWFHHEARNAFDLPGNGRMRETAGPSEHAERRSPMQPDHRHAADVLRALIRGVNPITGEALSDAGPLDEPDVLRALAAAVEALDSRAAIVKRQGPRAQNAGQPWSTEDDQRLVDLFDSGTKVKDLADNFGRTSGAITSRLARLGRLEPDATKAPAEDAVGDLKPEGAGGSVQVSMSPVESLLAAVGREWPTDVPPPPEELVWAEVDGLTPRTAKIVSWRHGRYGPPRSLKQIGDEIGVTRERIRQILVKAYRRLGHPSRRRMRRLADLGSRPADHETRPGPVSKHLRTDDRPDLRIVTPSLLVELVEAAGGRLSAARIAWVLVGSDGPMTRQLVADHRIGLYGVLRYLDFRKVRNHVVGVAESSPRLTIRGDSQEVAVANEARSSADDDWALSFQSIADLNLSARAHNALVRANIRTIGALLEKSDDDLVRLRNFGRACLTEVHIALRDLGLYRSSARVDERGVDERGVDEPAANGAAMVPADLLVTILGAVGGPVSASRIAWVLVGADELLTSQFIKRHKPPGIGTLRGHSHDAVRQAVLDCARDMPSVEVRDGVLIPTGSLSPDG